MLKRCSREGCTNHVINGGVCVRHGAKVKRCSYDGCTNNAIKGGVCVKHGATLKRCSKEGCTNKVVQDGVCIRHGAKHKRCSSQGCTNQAIKGGVCWRHGAYHNTNVESTAFGFEFEQKNSTRSQSNQHASQPFIMGRGGETVPGEVSVLCREIYEV